MMTVPIFVYLMKGFSIVTHEIKYINAGDTSLTLTARISQSGTQIGSLVNMTESGTLGGHYYADFPTSNSSGMYIIEIFDGALLKGDAVEFYWDGTKEINLLEVYNLFVSGGDINDILELIKDHARATNLQTQEQA